MKTLLASTVTVMVTRRHDAKVSCHAKGRLWCMRTTAPQDQGHNWFYFSRETPNKILYLRKSHTCSLGRGADSLVGEQSCALGRAGAATSLIIIVSFVPFFHYALGRRKVEVWRGILPDWGFCEVVSYPDFAAASSSAYIHSGG